VSAVDFIPFSIQSSSSEEFNKAFREQCSGLTTGKVADDEAGYFSAAGIDMIEAPRRESAAILDLARNKNIPTSIVPADIKGIIHCHSNWSDGSNTLEEMAQAAIGKGLEYLVISDHSKSAFYAQGCPNKK
jgi:DNA polymerase (family 10)